MSQLSQDIIDEDDSLKKELLRVHWWDTMEILKEMGPLFHLKDIQKGFITYPCRQKEALVWDIG